MAGLQNALHNFNFQIMCIKSRFSSFCILYQSKSNLYFFLVFTAKVCCSEKVCCLQDCSSLHLHWTAGKGESRYQWQHWGRDMIWHCITDHTFLPSVIGLESSAPRGGAWWGASQRPIIQSEKPFSFFSDSAGANGSLTHLIFVKTGDCLAW